MLTTLSVEPRIGNITDIGLRTPGPKCMINPAYSHVRDTLDRELVFQRVPYGSLPRLPASNTRVSGKKLLSRDCGPFRLLARYRSPLSHREESDWLTDSPCGCIMGFMDLANLHPRIISVEIQFGYSYRSGTHLVGSEPSIGRGHRSSDLHFYWGTQNIALRYESM